MGSLEKSQVHPRKRKSKAKKNKLIREAENEPGPSHINLINDSQDDESDMETEITDEEKCCVCKKYTPDEVRYSVSVIFTKWVKCDRVGCPHWAHLKFCTDVSVIRKGTSSTVCIARLIEKNKMQCRIAVS